MENFDDDDDDAQLDLTPLIDVVFLLLIFFIMATSFTKPVIDIVLPESTSATKDKKQEELVISITANGTLYYNATIITKEELAILLDTYPNKYLNIHVDKATPFEAFLHIVDYAKIKRNGEFLITTKEKK